jgi:hypothetical protein
VARTASLVAGLSVSILLASASPCARASDAVVAGELSAFFQAFTGRPLGSDELHRVTGEFMEIHALQGKDRPAIRAAARGFSAPARLLRQDQGSPAALTTRHALIAANYFNPDLLDTLALQLLTEPDPVRVFDVRSRRLMTQGDVVALANLRHFVRLGGAPRHRDLSRDQVNALAALLQATVGGNSGRMPQFFGEAAAYWAGVRQAWPSMTVAQRDLALAYAGSTWRTRMPVDMYRSLWGLSPQAAQSRHADDVSARLSQIALLNLQAGNLPLVMDAIFGR